MVSSTYVDLGVSGATDASCQISPGRFFAALELKCMLALTVLNYDVKMAKGGVRPADDWYGPASVPSHSAEVLFRPRRLEKDMK